MENIEITHSPPFSYSLLLFCPAKRTNKNKRDTLKKMEKNDSFHPLHPMPSAATVRCCTTTKYPKTASENVN